MFFFGNSKVFYFKLPTKLSFHRIDLKNFLVGK